MTTVEPPNQAEDGFDLIEYPNDYGFKAMCRIELCVERSATDHMRELVLLHVAESALLKVSSNQSRTGKFESVTLTVRLQSRQELEAIYQAVANSPVVVMTL